MSTPQRSGALLVAYRKSRGMSTSDLMWATQIHDGTLHRLQSGERNINANHPCKIIPALDLTATEVEDIINAIKAERTADLDDLLVSVCFLRKGEQP